MAKTPEEIKERLSNAKEKVLTTKDALKAFVKENGLKKGEDHSKNDDSKIAKKFAKLTQDIADAEARVEKYQGLLKGSKGASKKASSGGGAKTVYVYPSEVKTGEDKKKFRAETRSKCKKLGITTEEYMTNPAKYDKMVKSASKPAKEEAPAKPSKKKAAKEEAKPAKKKKTPKPEVEEEATESGSED